MAYVPLTKIPQQFFDNLGNPLVGGTLYAYLAGTSTPTNMFSDDTGTVAGTSVVLDSRGEPTTFKLIWLNETVNYKFILKDSTGSTIWTIDDISADDPTDASLVTYTPAGSGAVATTVQAKLRETKTLYDYGGVADYTGTPQYDGNDASRVTATDNTTAFQNLINAAIAAGHDSVRIPAGHWGIKTGNIAFSNFNKLRIYGDGIGVTILDFFKEDTTGNTYVTDATAQAIASFTTGNVLEFADMTIKATTKGGVVNGTTGPANVDAVYYGKIWGFKVNNVKNVFMNNVRVERFNYRGFSIYGASTEKVKLIQCEGFYNVGSGYWVVDADLLEINGGEFAYNGIFGNTGTGYGVTGSSYIGEMISIGAYYHNNYRKGLDTHGCANFTAIGNIFEDNVLYHLAAPNWVPPVGVSDAQFLIKGNKFSNGETATSRSFLQTCYQQLITNGFNNTGGVLGSIVSITDQASNGTRLNKIERIEFSDNNVTAHYNGAALATFGPSASGYPFNMWVKDSGKVVWSNNTIDLTGCQMPSPNTVYGMTPILIPFGSWLLNGDLIKWPETAEYTNTSYSVLTPVSLTWASNRATLTVPAGNNYQNNEIVTISGANEMGFNGTFVLTQSSANVYTYYVANPGAATATGTITVTVKDRMMLLATNGINITARNATFDVNNCRIMGSTFADRRVPADFTTKARVFSGCAFKFTLSPFEYIDDDYFAGRQYSGSINVNNNVYENRGIQAELPIINFARTQNEIVYCFPVVSKTTGQDVFFIVLDRAYQQTIYVSTNDGSADLIISVPFSALTGITGSAGNSLFEYSSSDPFFDDNGVQKLKITIKAKTNLSGSYWGRVTVNGCRPGLGAERTQAV